MNLYECRACGEWLRGDETDLCRYCERWQFNHPDENLFAQRPAENKSDVEGLPPDDATAVLKAKPETR